MVKAFCERLKELREEKGISQVELSKQLKYKLSASAIGRWENGERSPTLESLIILADFFCVTLDYLAGRQDY